ncbi:MAG: hypothetical protein QOD92_2557 [Acidimicrobiaceae bacterium]|jgi:hypothetical protein
MRKALVVLTVSLAVTIGVAPGASAAERSQPSFDRDGDGQADIAVTRAASPALDAPVTWYFALSAGGFTSETFGNRGDVQVPADYDGDGVIDAAVVRLLPSNQLDWFIHRSSDGGVTEAPFGGDADGADTPIQGDFDGDGKADLAVYRPPVNGKPHGQFFVWPSGGGPVWSLLWGDAGANDRPFAGDFDGDGKSDLGVRRPDTNGDFVWFIAASRAGFLNPTFGHDQDLFAPGDYDGDGTTDLVMVRTLPNKDYRWFGLMSSGGAFVTDWGHGGNTINTTDRLVPANYAGTGRTQIAVWRPDPTAGIFFVRNDSGTAITTSFGITGDIPVVYDYVINDNAVAP